MRVDRGPEFRGAFREYCDTYGVRVRTINTAWPRAQGQIERLNGVFKATLRKLISASPGSVWSEWVSDVLWSMRALVTRPHGFSPFRLVYKQEAAFPPALVPY